jgi:hypothetical protein
MGCGASKSVLAVEPAVISDGPAVCEKVQNNKPVVIQAVFKETTQQQQSVATDEKKVADVVPEDPQALYQHVAQEVVQGICASIFEGKSTQAQAIA